MYSFKTEEELLAAASVIMESKARFSGNLLGDVLTAKKLFSARLARSEREHFEVAFLASDHRLINIQTLFSGTINVCSVYPREVIKAALQCNAAAVVLAHNHPSGNTDPSEADKQITLSISNALKLIDVPILDHIIVGGALQNAVSFAELD